MNGCMIDLHQEIHNIINVERLLRGSDSPILEARMNYSLNRYPIN